MNSSTTFKTEKVYGGDASREICFNTMKFMSDTSVEKKLNTELKQKGISGHIVMKFEKI